MGRSAKIIGLLLAVLTGALAQAAPDAPPRVRIAQGELRGVRVGVPDARDSRVDAYLGIPYGAPPIGEARWRAPRPAGPWTAPRAADRFGPACWQPLETPHGPWTHEFLATGPFSEDCLSLNVWTPAGRGPGRGAPVLVWIHGGSYLTGSGAIVTYNGAALAARGVVVVTINYRLGVLGFLTHPDLAREAAGHDEPTGNYGLQDAVLALKWVRANIAAFGGDPDAVTIDGQSAGGGLVHDLVVSPLARGLFARAIAQSSMPAAHTLPTLAASEQAGAAFDQAQGGRGVAALRAMPPDVLVAAAARDKRLFFAPTVDGRLLPGQPYDLYGAPGGAADVPMLSGSTADDAGSFAALYGSPDAADYDKVMAGYSTPAGRALDVFYPAADAEARARMSRQVYRDRTQAYFRLWAQQRARAAAKPLYAYLFEQPPPGPSQARYGAFHSSELPYQFATLDAAPERGYGPADRAVSDLVCAYWLNFVRTGDPNGPSLPAWPAFADGKLMTLNAQPHAQVPLAPERWAAYADYYRAGGRFYAF